MAKNKYHFMLGKLFGSNARVKILKLFILHPRERFYIRQIARDLKLQLNSVRRELENLEQFGLLISNSAANLDSEEGGGAFVLDSKGNGDVKKKKIKALSKSEKKYYQVNAGFILYEEIKSLLVKAQFLYEREFISRLRKAGVPRLLILTGFFVNKQNGLVDMLLVGRFNKPKLLKIIRELEVELGREVNFAVMDMREFKYRKDITDIFLYDILEGKKIVAIDDLGVTSV
ncbi:MAG: hypothetical protein BWY51_00614 [Parcubacteria group bacterium ADurb.Bin316]|nr:MAG: hypothetical protein BWY51_00614 [Parcubacteria group bacterium ADurb.Bin316]HOZ56276.1 hypothetical protein [bacterium]